MHRRILALTLALAAATAFAQIPAENPDWKELEAPPPPALRLQGLVEIEVPGSTLRYAVEPTSISVGNDGVVRYVVVATGSGGAVNAMYEGLRCGSAEVKTYARHTPGSGWVPTPETEWRPLEARGATRHSLIVARSGACANRAPNVSPAQILRDLRAPPDRRFEGGGIR